MRPSILAAALLTLTAASAAFAHEHDNWSKRNSAEECSARNVRFDDEDSYVKKETIDATSLRSLKVAVTNAPVTVVGGNGTGYSITVCKAAEDLADLDRIRVYLDGNELKSEGPDNSRWTVLYSVRAPRNADLDLEARNGPIAIRNVDGKIVARLKNGPLSLDNVDGNVDVVTSNGPISIDGGSGTMKIEASNGPLSVDLDGASWNGSLNASTRNGPLSVRVPRGFGGVVVEARGHGPISCHADGCERAWRSDDDGEPRRIELGSGPANVHLSTVNGPVTIKDE
jgi:hypothetical protein